MANFGEYTTVTDLRQSYLGGQLTTDDGLILQQIREASRMIDSSAKRQLYPTVETRNFDIPRGTSWSNVLLPRATLQVVTEESKLGGIFTAHLAFDRDLLQVISLTNGDGSSIASAAYWLYPLNWYPKRSLKLKPTSGVAWLLDASGNWEQVIALKALWGYHEDYANAWVDSGGTVQNTTQLAANDTSLQIQAGSLKAGQLIRFGTGTDLAYVSAVASTQNNPDTCTLVRNANGSTAVAQPQGTPVYYWSVDWAIENLCRSAAAALYALRNNPVGETIILEGKAVAKPADVQYWIDQHLNLLGNERTSFG